MIAADATTSSTRSWVSFEILLVIGLLTLSLFAGSTLAFVAYTHGFTDLPNTANAVR